MATLYRRGTAVATVNAPARAMVVGTPGYTNRVVLTVQPGIQVSWPTTNGYTYEPQWTATPSVASSWVDLAAAQTVDGSTQSLLDPSGASRYYRVIEVTPPSATASSLIVNGGFELGSGTTPTNWVLGGTQPPVRTGIAARSGSFGLDNSVTNTTATPNGWQFQQNVMAQGGGALLAGQSYNFSFWAKQLSSGVSYVQNYRLSWLDASGATLANLAWKGFNGGNGTWAQITATNLVAPANTVDALIELYGTTGAVLHGYGEVLLDDFSLALNTPGQTNLLQPATLPCVQISWPSDAGQQYQLQWSNSLSSKAWTNSPSVISGDGSTKVSVEPMAADQATFYRITQLQ